ncbi:hypothetical protein D1007_25185 [Hordeum vulgare]|nr:hypothetical protein D1007_25185 [Hordeum vulgare]
MVYTNEPTVVVNSINMLEQLLAEDDKYKVAGFYLEYTGGCAGHDQKVHNGGHYQKSKGAQDFGFVLPEACQHPRDMKAEYHKDKSAWHNACMNELDEEHIKYAAKDAYTSYDMYRRIIDMRKCLLPAHNDD